MFTQTKGDKWVMSIHSPKQRETNVLCLYIHPNKGRQMVMSIHSPKQRETNVLCLNIHSNKGRQMCYVSIFVNNHMITIIMHSLSLQELFSQLVQDNVIHVFLNLFDKRLYEMITYVRSVCNTNTYLLKNIHKTWHYMYTMYHIDIDITKNNNERISFLQHIVVITGTFRWSTLKHVIVTSN